MPWCRPPPESVATGEIAGAGFPGIKPLAPPTDAVANVGGYKGLVAAQAGAGSLPVLLAGIEDG
jgi:hypothetical protein